MKTAVIKPSDIKRRWYVVDAADAKLGRLSTEIARVLRGKHKPEYTPNMDLGDYVVVINARKVMVTGNKSSDKIYYRHSGYPGGLKTINFEQLLAKKPVVIVEKSVRGMLPKGPLGRQMFKKLKVYAGSEHRHAAQNPELLKIET